MSARLLKALAILLCIGVWALPVNAGVVVDEDFSGYVDGPLPMQGNWGGHATGWNVDDATDTVSSSGAWLGNINYTSAPGPATTPNLTYTTTIDFSFEGAQDGVTENNSFFYGLADDASVSPFPDGTNDMVAMFGYNQWPNPNTTPPNQASVKFRPSSRIGANDNPAQAIIPEADLGLDLRDYDADTVYDLVSDNLRMTQTVTHTGGDLFDVALRIDNLDTGLFWEAPVYADTWADGAAATTLVSGFRNGGGATATNVIVSAFKFEDDSVSTLPDGDFNDDSVYDCVDVDALVGEIAVGSTDLDFDLTGDGFITIADLDEWRAQAGEAILGPGKVILVGDATLDGNVNGEDFIAWNNNKFTSTGAWCLADFNADGFTNGNDFIEWNNNKFMSSDSGAVNGVPEPATVGLLLFALLGLGARRRG